MQLSRWSTLSRRIFLIIFAIPAFLIVLVEAALDAARTFFTTFADSFEGLISVYAAHWPKRKKKVEDSEPDPLFDQDNWGV